MQQKSVGLGIVLMSLAIPFWAIPVEAAPVCDWESSGKPWVCVDKDGQEPIEGFNFAFIFSDADNPGVTFFTGSTSWKVWSQVSDTNTSPAPLGELKIAYTSGPDDFEIMIYNDDASGPGATNLGGAVLKDTGWSGYSSLAAGSIITGNVTGDIETVQHGPDNGEMMAPSEADRTSFPQAPRPARHAGAGLNHPRLPVGRKVSERSKLCRPGHGADSQNKGQLTADQVSRSAIARHTKPPP